MHAVALGNTGDCAEALREIAIALDYGGDNAQVRRTRAELTAAMRDIRLKARARQLAAGHGTGAGDTQLDAQASKGFGPVTEYQLSERSARIREMRRAVEAKGEPSPPGGFSRHSRIAELRQRRAGLTAAAEDL
jgi:hypothetical protein